MQKIILVIGIVCILLSLSYFGNKLRGFYHDNKSTIDPIVNLETQTQPLKDTIELPYEGKTLLASWFIVTDINSISLYSNLERQQDAREILKENSCKYLVNGGFYSKDNQHIGLFTSDGKVIKPLQQNKLFNGIFSIDEKQAKIEGINDLNTANIEPSLVRLSVQAGPILIRDNKVQSLALSRDSKERRSIVGLIDNENHIIFISLYQKDSTYLGPNLVDLPQILQEFENKSSITINDALNLDGGTASAFLTDSVALGELSPIGSYFCIK